MDGGNGDPDMSKKFRTWKNEWSGRNGSEIMEERRTSSRKPTCSSGIFPILFIDRVLPELKAH